MSSEQDIIQALIGAGYLTDADIAAAAAVLMDASAVAEAKKMLAEATRDKAYQDKVLSEAIEAANVDLEMGAFEDRERQQAAITTALDQQDEDFAKITAARETILMASQDAAGALLAAELIDEANLNAVAGLMVENWIAEGE